VKCCPRPRASASGTTPAEASSVAPVVSSRADLPYSSPTRRTGSGRQVIALLPPGTGRTSPVISRPMRATRSSRSGRVRRIVFGSALGAPPAGTRWSLIWDKGGGVGLNGDNTLPWKRTYERIHLVGRPFVGGRTRESVIRVPASGFARPFHPHEKPVRLLVALIETTVGTVLDPFMGSVARPSSPPRCSAGRRSASRSRSGTARQPREPLLVRKCSGCRRDGRAGPVALGGGRVAARVRVKRPGVDTRRATKASAERRAAGADPDGQCRGDGRRAALRWR
jgi:hypothetical protein